MSQTERRVIAVWFLDHVEETDTGWHSMDEEELVPARCLIVGFLVGESDTHIEVTDVVTETGQRARRHSILKATIVEQRELGAFVCATSETTQ